MCSNICVYIYTFIHEYYANRSAGELWCTCRLLLSTTKLPSVLFNHLEVSSEVRVSVQETDWLHYRTRSKHTLNWGKKTSNAESSSSTSKPEHWNKFLKAPHPTKKTLQIKCGIKTVSECHFNNFECIKGHFKKHPRRCESRDSKKVKQVVLSR